MSYDVPSRIYREIMRHLLPDVSIELFLDFVLSLLADELQANRASYLRFESGPGLWIMGMDKSRNGHFQMPGTIVYDDLFSMGEFVDNKWFYTNNLAYITFELPMAMESIIGLFALYRSKPFNDRERGRLQAFGEEIINAYRIKHDALERSYRDPLTGLRNRRGLVEDIKESCNDQYMAFLALMDLDGFKEVNDKWGHPAGDAVLRKFAELLNQHLPGWYESPGCISYRQGGDEFAVICRHRSMSVKKEVFEQLLRNLLTNVTTSFSGNILSFSCGFVNISSGLTTEEIVSAADQAQLEVKRKGKNGVRGVILEPRAGQSSFLMV